MCGTEVLCVIGNYAGRGMPEYSTAHLGEWADQDATVSRLRSVHPIDRTDCGVKFLLLGQSFVLTINNKLYTGS